MSAPGSLLALLVSVGACGTTRVASPPAPARIANERPTVDATRQSDARAAFRAVRQLYLDHAPAAADSLRQFVRTYAADPLAEYATSFLFELLARDNRIDELEPFAVELLANAEFVAAHPETADQLREYVRILTRPPRKPGPL